MSFGKLGAMGRGMGHLGSLGTLSPRQTYINALKAAGIFSKLDMFYLFAQPTAALAGVDLIAGRSLSITGSPTFTANKGYTGDGVSAFLDTGYNPSTNGVNISQNSNSIVAGFITATTDPTGGWDFGQANYAIGPFGSTNTQNFSRNASTSSLSKSLVGDAGSLYATTRNVGTGYDASVNGGNLYTGTKTSSGSNIFVSAAQEGQGWADDGSFYYTSTTSQLYKRSKVDWSVTASNTSMMTGVPGTSNHSGGFDIYNGNIIIPTSNWSGSCGGANSNPRISVYSCSDLSLVSSTAVSPSNNAMSGLAVDSARGRIYASFYCDTTVVDIFDLTTFAKIGTISLSTAPYQLYQDIAYKDDTLFLTGLNDGSNINVVAYDLSGTFLYAFNPTDAGAVGSIEGLNFSGSSCGIMLDNHSTTTQVNFYTLPTVGTTNSFTQASSAVNSANFTVFKRQDAAVFTSNQMDMVAVGGYLTQAQMAAWAKARFTYLRAIGAI
jgi:hypothetical protein